MYNSNTPITKKQVQELKPDDFQPVMSHTRFRDGRIAPFSKPRYKLEWSFRGTHSFKHPDGTVEQRPGCYVVKMRRP